MVKELRKQIKSLFKEYNELKEKYAKLMRENIDD